MSMQTTQPMPPPSGRSNVILVTPLVLLTTWAAVGQAMWAHDAANWPIPVAVAYALTVESVGIYLAAEAHAALMAGDSAIRLRVASYLVGGGVGALNYSHFAGTGLAPAAVTFGAFSALSPVLWAIRSRSRRREQLRKEGLIDRRAAHFSVGKWLHFPVRTWRALRWSIEHGQQDPGTAWAGAAVSQAGELRRQAEADAAQVREQIPAPPPEEIAAMSDEARAASARQAVVDMIRQGTADRLTGRMLGERYGRHDRWGRARIQDARRQAVTAA
jgi:hypothetical protein